MSKGMLADPPSQRKPSAQTELPPSKEAEGAEQEGAPARKAAAPGVSPERFRRDRDTVAGSARWPEPAEVERRDMRLGHARGAPTRQDRASQLRRDQEAAPKLRVMFPAVEQLRFELSFA